MKWVAAVLSYGIYFACIFRFTYSWELDGQGDRRLLLAGLPAGMVFLVIAGKAMLGRRKKR